MKSTAVDVKSYSGIKRAAYAGYVVQAIVNNLAPLLFIVFHTQYSIPLTQLGLIAALNFGVQLLTDFAAMFFVDKVGYRVPIVLAQVLSAVGLILMGVLPALFLSPFLGFVFEPISGFVCRGGCLCNWWRFTGGSG